MQESLNKFKQQQKQQQEKCRSTLTSIANPSTRSTHSPKQAPPTSRVAAPAKSSTDTERLQHINAIRKSPVGAQIKRVIDLLLETRQAFTPEQINEACYVDITGNKAVFDSLMNNHKVHYDGRCFSYKSKHDLKGEDQLLSLIRKFPEGLAVVDVRDSYASVMDDLQALKAAGHVWLLANNDSLEDIVYPNDPKAVIKVDGDLKQLFRGIELPQDMAGIERELQKSGMKPAMNTAKRLTKLTNAHLPEPLQSLIVPDS